MEGKMYIQKEGDQSDRLMAITNGLEKDKTANKAKTTSRADKKRAKKNKHKAG
jgi:hypothetical protein